MPETVDVPLILVTRAGEEITRCCLDHSPLTIGRLPENDLVLKDSLVSRRHARIVEEKDQWWIRDAGSRSKLRVAGQACDVHALRNGDRIGVGPFELLFLQSSRSAQTPGVLSVTQTARAESADVQTSSSPWAGPPLPEIPGYHIVREIGRGGTGRVYEATQLAVGRRVALKVMLEGPWSSAKTRRRFEREARIIGQLNHPDIVKVHDFGEHAGCHWLSMEFIDGRPLHKAVADWTLTQRLGVMMRICEAVGFAHEQKVIHRDLKPGNILVSSDGQPHVLDFGLAKMEGLRLVHEMTLSQPGALMGTPAYMSPEQTTRDPAKIDSRSDVYSLGVILYQLATGQFPYDVRCRIDQVVHNITTVDPVLPSRTNREIDAGLDAIILKALAKDARHRYADAAMMAGDLHRYLTGQAVRAKGPGFLYRIDWELTPRFHPLSPGMVLILLALFLSLLVNAILWATR